MVSLPNFKKFLCCMNLKMGGIVIGWLSAILSAVGAVFTIVVFAAVLQEITISSEKDLIDLIGFGIVCVIYFIFLCALCFASIQLIRGTKAGIHKMLNLYLLMICIGFALSFLLVIIVGLNGLGIAVISAILSIYSYLSIHSLREAMKNPAAAAAATSTA